MKKTLTSICSVLAIAAITSCASKPVCDHPTRLFGSFLIDIPADFDGLYEEEMYGGKKAVITGKDCNGPFNLKMILSDGTIELDKNYKKGELTSDTVYIEEPAPPYDLEMHVDVVYDGVEI